MTQVELEPLAATGLGKMSVRELLGGLLTSVGVPERRVYLDRAAGADKGRGSYERSLMVGSLPVEIEVPGTRSGAFRPRSLPLRFDRGYSEETQALLLGLLASARSVNAAKMALRKMGLSSSEDELDIVATNLVEAINGQLEVLRRNSGGYFQSEESMKVKLGLILGSLESGRWRRTAAGIASALNQLNALFEARFESEAAA